MKEKRPLLDLAPFANVLADTVICLFALMMLSDATHRQKQQANDANLKVDGKYAVTMEWPDASNDDVDLYVRDPEGNIVYFGARDLGLMNLDHDDQGSVSDHVRTSVGDVTVERNEERIVLRGTFPGEYVVNVHMYNKRDPIPTLVTVRLIRLKGEDAVILEKKSVLGAIGDERTAFRFTLDEDGNMTGHNELPRLMVKRGPGGGP